MGKGFLGVTIKGTFDKLLDGNSEACTELMEALDHV